VSAAPVPLPHPDAADLDRAAAMIRQAKRPVVVAGLQCRGAEAKWLRAFAEALPAPVLSISLRAWPLDFPDEIAVQRRAPYEARADAIMYRQELSELAHARGWEVHLYDVKAVLDQAVRMLAHRADQILRSPRANMGHRGRRTIGSRSRQRSSPVELQRAQRRRLAPPSPSLVPLDSS